MTTYTITTRVVRGGRTAMRDSKIYSLLCEEEGRTRMVDSFRAFTRAKEYAARIGTNGDELIVDGKKMKLRNLVWVVGALGIQYAAPSQSPRFLRSRLMLIQWTKRRREQRNLP